MSPVLAVALALSLMAGSSAQVVLSVDRLDGAEPGTPVPANLVVVDVFADVATTDTWTAGGMRAVTRNGAVLRYGAGNALVDPGLADRFVTCLSRPRARNDNARFLGAQAALAGRYDPTGPSATATANEVNVAWFSSPPATSTSPSVDGYIARVVIDISALAGIDPARIVVAPGVPPPNSIPLLLSQPAAGTAPTGTVAATFDVPTITGLNWCVYSPDGGPATLSVDRLDGAEPGAPAPANLVVVDVFVDVNAIDTWTSSGLRATAHNGAVLRYGAGNALVDPGLADRFVTCLSRPRARNDNARFLGAQAAVAGRYDPTGPSATATATEVNVAWFSSPPATSTSPSVDGYVARIVIDVAAVVGIDPGSIVVAAGPPPPGTVPLLVSQPSSGSSPTGTVVATFDFPTITGINWSVYADPRACNRFVPSADPTTGPCNATPFGPSAVAARSTVFARNNNGAIGGAVYFDLSVVNTLFVNGLSLNTGTPAGTPMTVQVYRTMLGGTRVGNETNAAVWLPMTMGFGTAAALDTPSVVDLNTPFVLTPGTYGIAVVAYGFRHDYTNGANIYSDANLTITTGSAGNLPFAGAVNTPRTANLELRYHLDAGAFTNQRYQTIVRRAQLTGAPITGLAFAACSSGVHWNAALLIRMSHVPAGHVLATTFASNLPAPLTVLDATDHVWPVAGNGWTEIGLQRAFPYDGVSDLVIEIIVRGNFHGAPTAFHRDTTVPRVAAWGWTGPPPTVASGANSTSDLAALKMRVQQGCADAQEFGWSCGRLRAGHAGQPVLGQAFAFTFTGAPANGIAFLNLGLNSGSPPYPFSMAQFGLRNCHLFHDIVATVTTFANGSGNGSYAYLFPVTPGGVGFKFHGQWLTIDASAPDGFALSNHVRMLCGTAQ